MLSAELQRACQGCASQSPCWCTCVPDLGGTAVRATHGPRTHGTNWWAVSSKHVLCAGFAVNSVEELDRGCLGYAGLVYEHVLGEEKYTFVEDVRNPHSCTILVKGPSDYSLAQMKVG